MNKTQTKIDAERYVAPAMNEHALAARKCIAVSGGENYTEDNGTDGTGNDY